MVRPGLRSRLCSRVGVWIPSGRLAVWNHRGHLVLGRAATLAVAGCNMKRSPAKADALPGGISPQLATLVEAPPKGAGWTYEIKLDGYRILARLEDGKVQLVTRNGNDWTAKMPHIATGKTRKIRLGIGGRPFVPEDIDCYTGRTGRVDRLRPRHHGVREANGRD